MRIETDPLPTLRDYQTGVFIRIATQRELAASLHARAYDGGRGVIRVPVPVWIIRDGGMAVTVLADPGAGPAHVDGGHDPCDCFTCNGTTVESALQQRDCYVLGELDECHQQEGAE